MSEKTTLEVGGLKFTGGKLFLVLTILSTLAGAAWRCLKKGQHY